MTKVNDQKKQAQVISTPSDEQVVTFLKQNPDFFVNRDELLLQLNIPHQHGDSVSLVERQVTLLRDKNIQMRHQLNELISAAKENDHTFSRSRELFLSLLDSTSTDEFFDIFENSLKNDFKCNGYRLIILTEQSLEINHWVSSISPEIAKQEIPGLIENNRPVLGVLRPKEQEYIFGSESSRVKSVAILPIKLKDGSALLAIGNRDPDYFHARMGTLFLNYIADILGRLIPMHV